ncbi:unnamed protein product [Aspergillus oryzae]|nr:unnamed protein product [Aspergillus oryzae]GMF95221.1 unnamed protein product [Aspergillus oryzae]
MRRTTNDILAGEQPMTPAEAPHMVQGLQEENDGLGVLDHEVADADLRGLGVHVGEELAVREGAVGAELVQDLGEWCGRHGDLTEVVKEGDLGGLVSLQVGWGG